MGMSLETSGSVVGRAGQVQRVGPSRQRPVTPSLVRLLGRSLVRVLAVSPILLAAACASIVSGNDTTTYIATDPEAARCELQGDKFTRAVNTPASISLPADAAPITVTCEADGFRKTSKDMDTSADGWIVGNILFGGLVGVAVDAATGAGQKYPDEITIVLEPEAFASLTTRDAWYGARREEISAEWEKVLQTVDNECNRNMKELCAEKKKEAEELRDQDLAALEQRRETAVVDAAAASAGFRAQAGGQSDAEAPPRGEAPSDQSGGAQMVLATPQVSPRAHPYDGTWTGTAVVTNPSCRDGASSHFDLTLEVENGRIHGGDPDGRYAATGEVGADGRLEKTSLNNYLQMEGLIESGIIRLTSRDCGARYSLHRDETH